MFRSTCSLFGAAVLCSLRLAAQETALEKEQKLLAGDWEVVSAMVGTEDDEVAKAMKITFTFDKNKLTVKRADGVALKAEFSLTLDTLPKLIDVTPVVDKGKSPTFQGIYELKEGELKLCVNLQGKDRPTEFKSGEANVMLIKLKRAKE